MKIKELLQGQVHEGGPDAADPRGIRPTTATGKIPVPSNFTTPVLAATTQPTPPTPISPVNSTAPGGPVTADDMRNMGIQDGLPTAMGITSGGAQPAGIQQDTSIPDLPARRNV